MTKSIPIDVNPNKPHFYPFMASLDRCNGSCNTLDYLPDRICVLNKADDFDNKKKLRNSINKTCFMGF